MYTYDVVDCVEYTSNIVFNSKRMTISRGGGKKSVDRKGALGKSRALLFVNGARRRP